MSLGCTDTCCRPEYEGPEVIILARRTPKAAKPHRCAQCPHPITTGTEHYLTVALIDGELTSERTHAPAGYPCFSWDNG